MRLDLNQVEQAWEEYVLWLQGFDPLLQALEDEQAWADCPCLDEFFTG